jgi:hypothetical protein
VPNDVFITVWDHIPRESLRRTKSAYLTVAQNLPTGFICTFFGKLSKAVPEEALRRIDALTVRWSRVCRGAHLLALGEFSTAAAVAHALAEGKRLVAALGLTETEDLVETGFALPRVNGPDWVRCVGYVGRQYNS